MKNLLIANILFCSTLLLIGITDLAQSNKPAHNYDTLATRPVIVLVDNAKTDSAISEKVDSTAKQIAPSKTTVGPVKLPTWALGLISGFLAVLPAVQLILKRIPTSSSVKIQGVLGWILDLLTFFQKDRSTSDYNKGVHK